MEHAAGTASKTLFDCIVIGAGPGGLQACIHLGRYNFRVLLFHSPGGRHSQAIISAGQGAEAAIEISTRIVERENRRRVGPHILTFPVRSTAGTTCS